jgi:hypothetical protein
MRQRDRPLALLDVPAGNDKGEQAKASGHQLSWREYN